MPTNASLAKILGLQFTIRHPYSVGHSCSAAEADVLNRALVRGASKGLFKVLTNGKSELGRAHSDPLSADEHALLQQKGEDYIAEFAQGFAQGHERLRAIRLEAERIAKQLLATRLNAQGRQAHELDAAELANELSELVTSERVRSEAERRVDVTQEIARRTHSELLEDTEQS